MNKLESRELEVVNYQINLKATHDRLILIVHNSPLWVITLSAVRLDYFKTAHLPFIPYQLFFCRVRLAGLVLSSEEFKKYSRVLSVN